MNIKTELEKTIPAALPVQLNDLDLDPEKIKAIMINEVVPSDPSQDFYGSPDPDYLKTTIPLFQKAGLPAQNIQDILQTGIYITNAVKTPKSDYTIERSTIETSLPYLEKNFPLPKHQSNHAHGRRRQKSLQHANQKSHRQKRSPLHINLQTENHRTLLRNHPDHPLLHHNRRQHPHRKIQSPNGLPRHNHHAPPHPITP